MILCSNNIQRARGVEDATHDEIEGHIKYHPGRVDPFPNCLKGITTCKSSPTSNAYCYIYVGMST
jgi:hypothetical protein